MVSPELQPWQKGSQMTWALKQQMKGRWPWSKHQHDTEEPKMIEHHKSRSRVGSGTVVHHLQSGHHFQSEFMS